MARQNSLGAGFVAAIFIILIIAVSAFFVPDVMGATDATETRTITQEESEIVTLKSSLQAELTNVSSGQTIRELQSIHTSDTDFNSAQTLNNLTVTGSGDSAYVEIESGGGTLTLDSFEDGSLSEYSGTGPFETTTNRAYDGSNSVTKSSSDTTHNWMYRDSSQFSSTANVTISVRQYYDGNRERGGPMLATSGGGGYAAFLDANPDGGTTLLIRDAPSASDSGEFIASESITDISESGWYRIYLRHDGNTITTWVEDDNGVKFGETVATDASHDPDRSGLWAFDVGIEQDLIEQIGGADPTSAHYVSATHTVGDSTIGFANVTLSNVTLTVRWQEDTGSGWQTVASDNFSTTGNHTLNIESATSNDLRANISFTFDGTNPQGEIHDEGIILETDESTGIDVTLIDTETGETVNTGNINESTEVSTTINGEPVSILNSGILNGNSAVVTYSYPTYYGYPDGAQFLFENMIGVLFMLIVLICAGLIFAVWHGGD